jgi:hypothetical protein
MDSTPKKSSPKWKYYAVATLTIVAVGFGIYGTSNDLFGAFTSRTFGGGGSFTPSSGPVSSSTVSPDRTFSGPMTGPGTIKPGSSSSVDYEDYTEQIDDLADLYNEFTSDYYSPLLTELTEYGSTEHDYELMYSLKVAFDDQYAILERLSEDLLDDLDALDSSDFSSDFAADVSNIERRWEVIQSYNSTMSASYEAKYKAAGDLEIRDVSVTVGADGYLSFVIDVYNGENPISDYPTRPMSPGTIALDGEYTIDSEGSSYFGIDVDGSDVSIDPGSSGYVEGKLSFEDRTPTFWEAYLAGESLVIDVTAYVNIDGLEEYDTGNNAYSDRVNVL